MRLSAAVIPWLAWSITRNLRSLTVPKYSRLSSVEPSLTTRMSKFPCVCRNMLSRLSGKYGMALKTGIPIVMRDIDLEVCPACGAPDIHRHRPHRKEKRDVPKIGRPARDHL